MAKDGDPKTILSKFLDWVREHGGRHMLYRGIAGTAKERPASAAIARRLPSMGEKDDEFISANQELIETARMRGHDTRKNLQCELDVLAELQHYGAATCLMDFTRNPLVGLWFACWSSDHKNGRVLAIDSGDYDRFVKINTDGMEKSIEYLLTASQRKRKLWVWEPKTQNERIIAQQSVFVFGNAEIQEPEQAQPQQPKRVQPQQSKYVRPEHVFFVENTEGVLDELQKYGMSLKSLFCDFDGFALANESGQQFGKENYLDKATEEHAHELHELAIKYYSRALNTSGDKSIYYHLGRARASLGAAARKTKADASKADACYKQAIEDYNESLNELPDKEKGLLHRGIAKGQLGDLSGAIDDFGQAISVNSDYAAAYNSRGTAKFGLGNYEDAIADYDRAIEINPQDAATYLNRGLVKKKWRDKGGTNVGYGYTSAIADYNRAIKFDRQDERAYNNLGNIKYIFGKYEGAIACYDQAIKLNPQHANAYYNRGLTKRAQGDEKGATKDFQKAEKLDPSLKPPEKE